MEHVWQLEIDGKRIAGPWTKKGNEGTLMKSQQKMEGEGMDGTCVDTCERLMQIRGAAMDNSWTLMEK